ncbi:MutS-like protein, partial [Nowakowskiella sp. JEL0407]
SLLIQMQVKECLVSDDVQQYEMKKIKTILDRCDIVCTERKKTEFTTKHIEQDLGRLLSDEYTNVAALPQFELKSAMACLAATISYLDLLSDEAHFGVFSIFTHDLGMYMRLDAAAVRALNLIPRPQDGGNKFMSLFGLLNRCKTSQGSRLLSQWIKQPLLNITDIESRLNVVEALTSDTDLRQSLQEDHLKKFPDLHRISKKFQKKNASLQDVVRVYQVIMELPSLRDTLSSYEGTFKELMSELFVDKLEVFIGKLSKLAELVETTVDLETVELSNEYQIKPDYDQELTEMKEKMDEIFSQLRPEAEKVAHDIGMEIDKKMKFEKNPQYGYHLRVSRLDASKVRNSTQYIELATLKNGLMFTTAKLRRLSEEYHELSTHYEKQQTAFVSEILKICSSYTVVLEGLNQIIAKLDVLVSFAHVSLHAPEQFVRPRITEKGSGNVELRAARHPCLEMQDDIAFISNDVAMIRGNSTFHIITGPNMGGKSTYIRQIGVISLMAQIGCFVPCSDAQLCVFDSILARVGAGDSQLKGVSTFMAEMLETASILRAATPDSLIIIDELGRGTSTYDGFGLAWAISEFIVTKIGCFTLFATHFHELTALCENYSNVKNWCVGASINDGRMTLLYQVSPGICDESFGIHVAELANFPEKVIKMAKRKASELEDFSTATNDMVSDQNLNATLEKENELIDEFLAETKELYAAQLKRLKLNSGPEVGDKERNNLVMDIVKELKKKYLVEFNTSGLVKEVLTSL